MKLDALEHPKILDFAARLGVTRPTALGHLELLWAFTGKHAPQGDIGKWPDGAIARACDYMGDPNLFLQSLLQSGLIDANAEHRYLIHDWPEHAPRWVRAKLAKAKQDFISISRTVVRSTVATTDETSDDDGDDCSGFSVSEVKSSEEKSLSRSELTSGNKQSARTSASTSLARPSGKASEGLNGFDPKADEEGFARIKAAYPKFAGRQDWISAELACHTRIEQDGETWSSLLTGVERYAKHIRAKGSEGTQFVLTPAKFFSAADQPWRQEWPIPTSQKPHGNGPAPAEQRSVDERENEIIVRAIRDGLTDAQISGLEDLAIAPDLPRRIRALRKEVQREQH